jgi:hypothetical protein
MSSYLQEGQSHKHLKYAGTQLRGGFWFKGPNLAPLSSDPMSFGRGLLECSWNT